MSEIDGIDNKTHRPYENTGIEEGDMIIEVANKTISCTSDLVDIVSANGCKELNLKYVRNGNVLETSITPIQSDTNQYKLGLWVRDTAARNWYSNIL